MRKTVFNGFRPPLAPLVLPAVYDDVLSYEEWLAKVVQRCNELSDYITETLEYFNVHIEDIVDARIKAQLKDITDKYDKAISDLNARVDDVSAQIDGINNRLTQLDEKIDRRFNNLKKYIDDKLLEILANFNHDIYEFFLQCKRYTDNKVNEERIYRRADINEINARLDSYIREFPLVYCPPIGNYTDVESSIVYCWNSLRYFALTAGEYDAFEYTCVEFADLALTALEYDLYGAEILKDSIKQMFNPFTGKNENIRDVVNYIAMLLKYNAKTATEYDGYGFTASEFDASDFNAYRQDSDKYYETPDEDKKNKFYKSYLMVYNNEDPTQTQNTFTFTFNKTGFKGLSLLVKASASAPAERVDLEGLGSYAVANASGVRTVTIAESGANISVSVSDNVTDDTTTPATVNNDYNIIVQCFRRGSSYDVTQLDA